MPKANTFHGSFVFIHQGYEILSSIYQNTDTTTPYPETAKRFANNTDTDVDEQNDLFAGQYYTVWLEASNNDHVKATLIIQKKSDNTYSLEWTNPNPNNTRGYKGIGMIHDDKLIGCYWIS